MKLASRIVPIFLTPPFPLYVALTPINRVAALSFRITDAIFPFTTVAC